MWLGVSYEVLLSFRERRADLMQPMESVESDVLDLLVGSSYKYQGRHSIRGGERHFRGEVRRERCIESVLVPKQ